MSSGYSVLPLVYDRWQESYGKDYSTLILPRLLATITAFDIPKSSLLDLACGTGTLALAMHRRGWKVVGVDASPGMIRVAEEKARAQSVEPHFMCADMRTFRLPEPVTLVTCFFDSLNHLLTKRDLLAAFRSVHAALGPDGFFVFDLNNERCFRKLWTKSDTIRHRDFTLVLRNRYQPSSQRAYSEVHLHLPGENGQMEQVEVVCERHYPDRDVKLLLRKAGFRVLQREEFNFSNRQEIGKIKTWWVAQRVEHSERAASHHDHDRPPPKSHS